MKTITERLAAVEAELRNLGGLIRSDSEQVTLDNCVPIHTALVNVRSAVIYADSSLAVRHRRFMAQSYQGVTVEHKLHERIMAHYHTEQCFDKGATENTPVCGQQEGWPDQATLNEIDETP